MAGLYLDPWQEFVLRHALGEREDGKWAAFEVGVTVSRQNGKGGLLEARELTGLFLLGERLLVHSAHQFDTSLEAFRRLEALIDGTPDFSRRVKRISRSHGEEGIELTKGQRIRFRTRTKGGGRGFTADWLGYDEDMVLPEMAHGATLPTLSARPNPQVWYMGSAVDQELHEHGIVKSRLRARAMRGDDPSLAYFEWSVDAHPEDITDEMVGDPNLWAEANPALGIRISTEHVGREQRSMDPRTFAVERLGAGDWYSDEGLDRRTISQEMWSAIFDALSASKDPVCFAFDVSPNRSTASISVAGKRPDGLGHIEVVEHRKGTGWVVDRLAELVDRHDCVPSRCDSKGPAASLVPALVDAGVPVETLSAAEYAQACGVFFDAVDQKVIRHLGTAELTAAVKNARRRALGDSWAWSRKASTVDISPLVASTLAFWGLQSARPQRPFVEVLS